MGCACEVMEWAARGGQTDLHLAAAAQNHRHTPPSPRHPSAMDPQLEFELRTHEKRASLARVLHYIKQRADKDLHRKGGCSAFQVTVELARCLAIAFTISLRNCSPSIEAATRFVIHCCALVGADEEAGKCKSSGRRQ